MSETRANREARAIRGANRGRAVQKLVMALKLCPWCKIEIDRGTVGLFQSENGYRVGCMRCKIYTAWCKTEDEACQLWDYRRAEEPLVEIADDGSVIPVEDTTT